MKRKSRILKALAVVVALATFSVTTNGVTFSDSAGHWGNAAIDPWSNYGVLNGYPDGSFKPDASMTRAEMAQTLNALMKLEDQAATNPFKDMTSSDWFYAPVLKAVQAKYIYGYEDGTFRDAKNITRQEAMVMLARAFHIEEAATINKSFSDANTIGAWARGLVYAMVNAGIVNGVSNTRIDAGGIINRASVAMILHKAISTYAYEEGKVYTASGNGITLIAGKNITVNGTVNNMIIAAGASNSNAIIAGASISGKVWVDAKNCTIYATAAQKDKITLLGDGSKIVVDGITPTPYSGLTTGDPVPGSQYPYGTVTPGPVVTNTPTFTPTPIPDPVTYDIDITFQQVQDETGKPVLQQAGPYLAKDNPYEAGKLLVDDVFMPSLTGHASDISRILDGDAKLVLLGALGAYGKTDQEWSAFVDKNIGNVSGADQTLVNFLKNKNVTVGAVGDGTHKAIFAVYQTSPDAPSEYTYYQIIINIKEHAATPPVEPETPTNTPTPGPDKYNISMTISRQGKSSNKLTRTELDDNRVVAENFAGILLQEQSSLESLFANKEDAYYDAYAEGIAEAGRIAYGEPDPAWANFVNKYFVEKSDDPNSTKVLNHIINRDRYNTVGNLKAELLLRTEQGAGTGKYFYYTVLIEIEKVLPEPVPYTISISISNGTQSAGPFTRPKQNSNRRVAADFALILKEESPNLENVFVTSAATPDIYAAGIADEGETAYRGSDADWAAFVEKYFFVPSEDDIDAQKVYNHLVNKDTYNTVGDFKGEIILRTKQGDAADSGYRYYTVTLEVTKE